MRWTLVVLAMVLSGGGAAHAQETFRAKVMGSPRVGRPTPPVVLPSYVTAGGQTTDGTFSLGSELGRVVVIAFGGRPDPALRIDWSALAKRADSLGSPRVALVGVVRGGPEEARALSGSLGGGLRILADSGGRVHRQFGVSERDRDWTIFVVADDGSLVARERVNTLADGTWWATVLPAVRRGVTTPGR